MSQKERLPLNLQLSAAREQVGEGFTPSEISYALDMLYRPFSRETLDGVRTQSGDVRAKLAEARNVLRSPHGLPPSRPFACAKLIEIVLLEKLQDQAEVALRIGNIPQFMFWWDLSYGAATMLTALYSAEEAIEGKVDQTATEALAILGERETPATAAGKYLTYMNSARDYAYILTQDPSGFRLVDYCVGQLKATTAETGRLPLAPYQIREFVTAGAEITGAVYKAIYPLSA